MNEKTQLDLAGDLYRVVDSG